MGQMYLNKNPTKQGGLPSDTIFKKLKNEVWIGTVIDCECWKVEWVWEIHVAEPKSLVDDSPKSGPRA